MYKYHNGLLPRSFDNVFIIMKSIHNYDTRGKDNYRAEVHRLNDVLSLGPRLWNSLPKEMKEANCLSKFKTGIKEFLKGDH